MERSVSELDLLDLQKQGQALYGQKKYEEALKHFDQVCGSHQPLSTFLTGIGDHQ